MTALEKLKKTFDELGIFYVEEIDDECGPDWIYIYVASEKEAKINKLDNSLGRQYFEFKNGELASY